MAYRDLHDHVRALEDKGLLRRISQPIDKNTELHPLVRLQFRGLEEKERKAFLFENVTDCRNTHYRFPVLAAGLAASREMYAIGMQCEVDEINGKWLRAMERPIAPIEVSTARVQQEVHYLEKDPPPGSGLDMFPIPISTPGLDPAPFLTCAHWITHDPVTGIRNVGNYRGHVKAPNRLGLVLLSPSQGIHEHWKAARKRGEPLEVAIVVGAPPVITYAAASKVSMDVDELAVAGALAGEPIPVVRCKTSSILVPADAEIVLEGQISTEYLEPEGPFGEFLGHMHPVEMARIMEIKCITYRKDAIWASLMSQLAPSESSVMRRLGSEAMYLRQLRDAMGIKSVKRVVLLEPLLSVRKLAIIQMDNPHSDQTRRALLGAVSYIAAGAKMVIAVNEDIDPEDLTSVFWAMGLRCRPNRDITIIPGFHQNMSPPFDELDEHGMVVGHRREDESVLLIDATRKQPFPPVSLPKREYMERALEIWQQLGMPALDLKSPWYGYELGQWPEALDRAARAAVKGDYQAYGADLARRRIRAPEDV